MAKYYYTTSIEPKPVYHDNQSCEEGKKIEAKNRADTDTVPADRDLCEVFRHLHAADLSLHTPKRPPGPTWALHRR